MPDPEATFIPEALDFSTRPKHTVANTPAPTDWSLADRPAVIGTLHDRRDGSTPEVTIPLTNDENALLRQLFDGAAARAQRQS